MVEPIDELFPGLTKSGFLVTSPATRDYNCIAWAADDTTRWWWPDRDPNNDAIFWPESVVAEETLDAFLAVFTLLGYAEGCDEALESGFEKVALFANAGVPTHAARQLPSGLWTSKLGLREDIQHELHALSGAEYGAVVLIMKRSLPKAES
jgi:hypothetical protein